MLDVLQTPAAKIVIMLAVLLILVVIGLLVVLRLRGLAVGDGQTPTDHLAKFRELRDEGYISPEEYRQLTTVLSNEIQQELKSNGKEV